MKKLDCRQQLYHELYRCALSTFVLSAHELIQRSALTCARLDGLEVDLCMTGERHLFSNVIDEEYIYWQYCSIVLAILYAGYALAQTPSNMVILLAGLATRLDPTCISPSLSGHLQNYDDPISQALIPSSLPTNMDELDQSEQSHAKIGRASCRERV